MLSTVFALAIGCVLGASTSLLSITLLRRRAKKNAPPTSRQYFLPGKVFEGIATPVIVVEMDGTISEVNSRAEKVFDYDRQELTGQSVQVLVPQRYQAAHKTLYRNYLKNPETRPMGSGRDLFARKKSGAEIPVEIGLNPIDTAEGRKIVVSVYDLSERLQSQCALEESNQRLTSLVEELNTFTFHVSHDLKRPLRQISNYATMLQSDLEAELSDQGKKVLNNLVRLTQEQNAQIDHLLHISRLGRVEINRKPLLIDRLIQEVVDGFKGSDTNKNIILKTDDNLPQAMADPVLVRELLENLVGNAVKYTPNEEVQLEFGTCKEGFPFHHPDVVWSTVAQEEEQVFYLRDWGIGISPEQCHTIFQIFQRLHNPGDFGGGYGVGLFIVQRIIEKHQGKIWVETNEGQGTTFFFTLNAAHNPNRFFLTQREDVCSAP